MNIDSKLLIFADDMSVLIIANNLQDLQTNTSILNQMNKWSIANGLSLNIEKTNVIDIKLNHFQDSPFQISYQNVEIKEVTNTKFLGLGLDQHMEWTHIDLIITIYISIYTPSPVIISVISFMLSKGGDNRAGGLYCPFRPFEV